MVLSAFAHSELLSALWIKQGIVPNTLAPGTVNTYDASPQPAAGIDTWDGGSLLCQNLLVVIDVASATGTGGLVVTLRDCKTAITTGNGDANTKLAATLATITAAGIYTAEFQLTHVYPKTSTRYLADTDYDSVMRYISLRAVATTHTYVFSALVILGNNSRKFPAQDATALGITWYDS